MELLALLAQIGGGGFTGANEIAHRLVNGVGHPDRREFAGAEETRERHCVASVRLDASAWLLRDQRRRHHHTLVPEPADLPVQAVADRAGLVAEIQLLVTAGELPENTLYCRRRVIDLADVPD